MKVDQKLISSCKKQERKAQFELYKNCYGVLMGICLRYHKNKEDAQAILNVGFLKILNGLVKYDPTVPFEAWIRRIMINTIIDQYRKERKNREYIEYADFQENDTGIQEVDFNEAEKRFNAEQLEKMIHQLPNVSQQVFNLHAIDGYSHKEIAEKMGMSVGTSKWHVSHARKELKKMIELKLNPVQTT